VSHRAKTDAQSERPGDEPPQRTEPGPGPQRLGAHREDRPVQAL